jgi:hypothetical protein
MNTSELLTARAQVEKLERDLLQGITETANVLGYELTKKDGTTVPPTPARRKRRTKAEIEAARAAGQVPS